MALKFHTSVTKGLKPKFRKFGEPTLIFVEVSETGRGDLFKGQI